MLVEFRVANFRSFRDEQVFSMVASKDEAHPENLIKGEKFNLLKAAALYGANASGKSNFIKAISCMFWFIENSATRMNIGDKIPGIVPFKLDKVTQNEPTTFEITVQIYDTRYEYGFSATNERVYDEWLFAYPPPYKKRQKWLERSHEPKLKQSRWAFRGPLAKEEGMLISKTRDNGLVLSRGAELNIEALNKLYLWFRKSTLFFDMSERPEKLMQVTAKVIKENKELLEPATAMIRDADVGIEGVSVVDNYPENTAEQVLGGVLIGSSKYSIYTTHRISGSDELVEFDLLADESNGTKTFFTLSIPFLKIIYEGGLLIVDELEASLHPLLMRKLIELFQSEKVNKKGAQLIFATHASEVMDLELFRRDQIWIVDKKRGGDSELYSIYDFATKDRPRNSEALLQRKYLAGRYGGVPDFGPIFEDLEF